MNIRGLNKSAEIFLRDPDTGATLSESFLFAFLQLGKSLHFGYAMKDMSVDIFDCTARSMRHIRIGKTNWTKITDAMVEAGLLVKSQGVPSLFMAPMPIFNLVWPLRRYDLPPPRLIGQAN